MPHPLILLLRPHQYIKNFLILAPLFFALEINNIDLLIPATLAFIAFSMCASAGYIFNDYQDIESDKLHPDKKNRPLAAGTVSKNVALVVMGILFLGGISLMLSISLQSGSVLLCYIAVNFAYSLKLKHIPIIDVNIIAFFFILRLFIGSTATGIPLSMWIVVMTFLLALFLAFAKRRDDVIIFMNTGESMRKVVSGYNLQFLDSAMTMMTSVVVVSYILYTTSNEITEKLNTDYLYLTTGFVILGVLRYLQISMVEQNSGSPTKIVLKDRFMQLTIAAWVVSFAWILYL